MGFPHEYVTGQDIYYGSESGGGCAPERMQFYSPPNTRAFLKNMHVGFLFFNTASGYLMLEMMFVRGSLSGPASPH